MDVEYTLGKRLQALRLANGYMQQDVADALETSASNVSNWEIDYSEPKRLSMVRKLCKLYNCTSDFLLGLSEYDFSAEAIKLMCDFDKLDEDGKHTVRAVLDSQLALHSRVKADP